MEDQHVVDFLTSKLIIAEEYRKLLSDLRFPGHLDAMLNLWENVMATCEQINIVTDSDVGTHMMLVLLLGDSDWKTKLKCLARGKDDCDPAENMDATERSG